jgi:hypothetical protein
MYQEIKLVPPEAGFTEQRRWARYKTRILTCVIAQKPMKALIVPGHGSQLNHGGMTVFAGIELAVNDQIRVTFTPPYGGKPLTFQCVVRDRNGYTYGVEFIRDQNDGEQISQMQRLLDDMEDFSGSK